jgi:hypothetical protein
MSLLTSCSSSVVTTEWQNPTTTQIRFTKVLALCIAKDPYLRQAAEGELCRHMTKTECKPAAFAIADSMIAEPEKAKELTRKEGFDGAVVFRVLDAHEQVTYFPPTYGPTFWGYYGYAWPMAINPGYLRTDQVVIVETGIFSLARDELLWLGTTKTLNPKSLPGLVEEVAKGVRDELVDRKLIPAS